MRIFIESAELFVTHAISQFTEEEEVVEEEETEDGNHKNQV